MMFAEIAVAAMYANPQTVIISNPKFDITIGSASFTATFVKSREKTRTPKTFMKPAASSPFLTRYVFTRCPGKRSSVAVGAALTVFVVPEPGKLPRRLDAWGMRPNVRANRTPTAGWLGPGWRKCTAYPKPGQGSPPLGVRWFSEGLGRARTTAGEESGI